jgi:hypothetical protein
VGVVVQPISVYSSRSAIFPQPSVKSSFSRLRTLRYLRRHLRNELSEKPGAIHRELADWTVETCAFADDHGAYFAALPETRLWHALVEWRE